MAYSLVKSYPTYLFTKSKLFLEAFVLWFLSISITLSAVGLLDLELLIPYIGISIAIWFIPLTGYILYKISRNQETESGFTPGLLELGLWGGLSLLSLSIYAYPAFELQLLEFDVIYTVPFIIPLLYTARLFRLYDMYAEQPSLYTDKNSVAKEEWEAAAIAFKRAMSTWDAGHRRYFIFGLFWSMISIGRYQAVMNKIESNQDREYLGARTYAKSASALYTAFTRGLYSSKKAEKNIEDFRDFLSKAHVILSTRACDSCENVYTVDQMYRILNEDGVEQNIYCHNCYDQKETSHCPNCDKEVASKFIRDGYCQYCNPYSQQNQETQQNKHTTSSSTSSTSQQTTSTTKQRIKNHCKVLGIEPPITEDKITNAYRERVKETHPDMPGGDEEEFKKVKKAKEALLKNL